MLEGYSSTGHLLVSFVLDFLENVKRVDTLQLSFVGARIYLILSNSIHNFLAAGKMVLHFSVIKARRATYRHIYQDSILRIIL
jgi:hypothetical protein